MILFEIGVMEEELVDGEEDFADFAFGNGFLG